MTLDDILQAPPKLHRDANRMPITWALSDEVLRFMHGAVSEGSRTLETGAGISTIMFALAGTNHHCVVPEEEEVELIKQYCAERHVSLSRVAFHVGGSETLLPSLGLQDLDLVLIDGRHGFPTPFIDWYYAAEGLKTGGLMVIDDIQLWTGRVLRAFLAEEVDWHLEKDFPQSTVFRKLRDGEYAKEWDEQPFVVRNSFTS